MPALANNEIPIFGGPHHGMFQTVRDRTMMPPNIRMPCRNRQLLSRRSQPEVSMSDPLQFETYDKVDNPMANGACMGYARAYVWSGRITRAHLEQYRDWVHLKLREFSHLTSANPYAMMMVSARPLMEQFR